MAMLVVGTHKEENVNGDLIATHSGQILVTHGPDECLPPCTIHSPSDHHMVGWPQLWRDDRGFMERTCPHGIGHPDPDDLAVRTRAGFGVHGCDGCCRPPQPDDVPTSPCETP